MIILTRVRDFKAVWKWVLAILLTVVLIYGNIFVYDELTKLPPREAVEQGLIKTINARGYRYRTVAVRTLEGEESVISDISGERNLTGVHLKGTLPIIKAEVELYQFNDVIYRRDSFSGKWLLVPVKDRIMAEQMIAELNPLGVFNFSEDTEVRYAGKEKVDGKTCRIYEIMSRGENKFLELYWNDFNYRLWLDKREGYIRKAEIMAEHRDNSLHLLKVTLRIWDVNETIEITPPGDSEVT